MKRIILMLLMIVSPQIFATTSTATEINSNSIREVSDRINLLENQIEQLDKTIQRKFQKLEEKLSDHGNVVIQRRMDGSVNFFRPWADYKQGFGNNSGEFFIGLEKLHRLTNSRPYDLLIVLEDWEGDRRYAKYDTFIVGSETEKYSLKSLGAYSGSAGDAMSAHLGQKFSTYDQDNDAYEKGCANEFTGAWWYNKCHQSNLNGRYLKGTTKEYAQGVNWYQFKGHHYSLKFVEMTIRPR
ncbi:ficolin-1-like [Musca vetustissima]|uniref:ficolin-1-like n=1 Tax=Musca vetustissima TaxID=27455 RepID=UPI002AB76CC1|nr:ficolin-1-like [Musca vetustissima]